MCTTDNIRLLINPITFLKLILALYVCIVGIQFASTDFIHKAYGVYFISSGVGIFFMGFFSGGVCLPQTFAVKRHNKFLLLVCFFVDTLLMTQAITVGIKCYSYTIKQFSPAIQNDCLLNSPEEHTNAECLSYLRHDSTTGMRLAWASFFSLSDDPKYYQYISTLQDDNLCCGFGPPLRCVNDTRKPPPDRPLEDLDSLYVRRRVTCGETARYYPQQDNCLHYFDPNSIPQIIGGCEYDMAVGNCVDDDAVIFNSYGCANYMEDFVASFVAPQALLLMGSSGMNILSMIVSCCMLWKRKNSDVFPDFIHEKLDDDKGKPKRIIVYDRIKDNVVVVPQADILYARGFLPRPGEGDEAKEEDEEEVELTALEEGSPTEEHAGAKSSKGNADEDAKVTASKKSAKMIEDGQSVKDRSSTKSPNDSQSVKDGPSVKSTKDSQSVKEQASVKSAKDTQQSQKSNKSASS